MPPGGEQPLVSVIVAAFNAEATIADALRSALGQSWRTLEAIVVDDGSTDRTAEIAEGFARDDARVTLIRQANAGPSAALNRAIARSRGAFVATLDADDVWDPAKIERQIEAALGAPRRPGFVYTFFRRIDMAGRAIGDGEALACRGPALHRLVYKYFPGTGSATLFDRAALVEAGGYDERLRPRADHLLHLRIARRHPVEVVPERLMGYRMTPGSLSSNQERVFEDWRKLRRLFREECPALPAFVWRWAHAKQCYALADARAWRGHYWSALAPLAAAIALDPKRSLGHLVYRLRRTIGRRLRRAPAVAAAPGADPHEIERAAARLGRLEARRFARLAALDAAGPG